ncbi:MAG: DUF6275 family protein [Streptococcus orisratti]|nr:DUF6275 family protein [Streptococcus orisratti]
MTKCDFVTGKKYPMTQQKFEKLAKERIVNLLPIVPEDVYMVWFNFTLGNARGLFSFETKTAYPMSHKGSKLPDYVEVTYNKEKNEMYFDWYTKERQEVLEVNQ